MMRKKKKKQQEKALNKGNDRWIAENKDEFLEKHSKTKWIWKKIQNLEDNRKIKTFRWA